MDLGRAQETFDCAYCGAQVTAGDPYAVISGRHFDGSEGDGPACESCVEQIPSEDFQAGVAHARKRYPAERDRGATEAMAQFADRVEWYIRARQDGNIAPGDAWGQALRPVTPLCQTYLAGVLEQIRLLTVEGGHKQLWELSQDALTSQIKREAEERRQQMVTEEGLRRQVIRLEGDVADRDEKIAQLAAAE